MHHSAVVLALIVFSLQGSWCQKPALKVTQLDVPPHVQRGEDVKLRCIFSNQEIASIKWFLNDEQFFRYMPYEDPPMEFYPVQGENGESKINIDLSRSNGSEVYLTNMNLSASGTYRCMVTEDGPFFRDDTEEANLTVTVIPIEHPSIEGEVHKSYKPGDTVALNCTSAPSVPPAKLVWIVNDKQATEDILKEYAPVPHDDGLVESKLGLNLKLTQQDFIKGELKLKCTATIASSYHKSAEHGLQKPVSHVEQPDLPTQGASTKTKTTGSGHIISANRILSVFLSLLLLLR